MAPLKTSYDRVKLVLAGQGYEIDVLDNTFTERLGIETKEYPPYPCGELDNPRTGLNYVPFGVAGRGGGGSHTLPKLEMVSTIDLRGTPFQIAEDETWRVWGYLAIGYANIRNNRQTVRLYVTGNNGFICPAHYPRIILSYAGSASGPQ